MKGKIIIETERLYLREMTADDFLPLKRVLADSDIMRHYPYTFDDDRVKGWIDKNISRYREYGFGLFAVCLKENDDMIGDCGLTIQNIDGELLPEIGFHIRSDMQRKGYAKECALSVSNWAFKNTKYSSIYSYMKSDNIPSINTAKSYGAKLLKEFIDCEGEISVVYKKDK